MGAGVAAAAVAVGVAQLLALFFPPAADVRTAVGTAVINLTRTGEGMGDPTFGTADKLFLSVMVLVVIAALAALSALWNRRSWVRSRSRRGRRQVRRRVWPGPAPDLRHHPDPGRRGLRSRGAATADVGPDHRPAPTKVRADPGRRLSLVTLGSPGWACCPGSAVRWC